MGTSPSVLGREGFFSQSSFMTLVFLCLLASELVVEAVKEVSGSIMTLMQQQIQASASSTTMEFQDSSLNGEGLFI